jgi:hypothetical protein
MLNGREESDKTVIISMVTIGEAGHNFYSQFVWLIRMNDQDGLSELWMEES